MHPRFAFKRLSNGPFGSASQPSPSRCQLVWQCVLVLAALALALATAETSYGAAAQPSPRHQLCLQAQTSDIAGRAEALLKQVRVNSPQRLMLLKGILSERERLVSTDLQKQKAYLACVQSPKASPICLQARNQMRLLDESAQSARILLGFSQSQYEWATWRNKQRSSLNFKLSPLGSFKMVSWAPMTFQESAWANEAIQTFEQDLVSEYPGAQNSELRETELLRKRYAAFVDYVTLMSQQPLLQWIQAPRVGPNEFKSALEQSIRLSEKDLSGISRSRSFLDMNATRLDVNASVNSPVLYTGIVNTFATRNERMCWALLKMKDELQTQQNREQVLMTAGMIGLMLIPGPGSFIALTIAGAAMVASSQYQYQSMQTRELGTAFVDWNRIEAKALAKSGFSSRDQNLLRFKSNKALHESKVSRNIDAVTVVIGLPLVKSGKFALKTSVSTLNKMNWSRSVLLKRVVKRGSS